MESPEVSPQPQQNDVLFLDEFPFDLERDDVWAHGGMANLSRAETENGTQIILKYPKIGDINISQMASLGLIDRYLEGKYPNVIFVPNPLSYFKNFFLNSGKPFLELRKKVEFFDINLDPICHRVIAEAMFYDFLWQKSKEKGFEPAIPKFHGLYFERVEDQVGTEYYKPVLAIEYIEGAQSLRDTLSVRDQPSQPTQPTISSNDDRENRRPAINHEGEQKDGAAYEPRDTLEQLHHVAETLDWMHKLGIIHRDIKPANIVFDQNGAWIFDFGICLLDDETLWGLQLGTPAFMPYERIFRNNSGDKYSDLYSFAIVIAMILAKVGDPFSIFIHDPENPRNFWNEIVNKFNLDTSILDAEKLEAKGLNQAVIDLLLKATQILPDMRAKMTLTQFLDSILKAMDDREGV